MIQRTKTRGVMIGTVKVGDYAPIVVQSMCDTHTSDIDATVKQIHDLTRSGCDVVRVAVDSKKDIEALAEIRRQIKIPLIADIHFNYKLAFESSPFVEKVRVNPGHLNHMEKSKPLAAKTERPSTGSPDSPTSPTKSRYASISFTSSGDSCGVGSASPPIFFVISLIAGAWDHMRAAISKIPACTADRARSGPAVPPAPRMEWHLRHPFSANTIAPRLGLPEGMYACALATPAATSSATMAAQALHAFPKAI
jgi:hypothetical protein